MFSINLPWSILHTVWFSFFSPPQFRALEMLLVHFVTGWKGPKALSSDLSLGEVAIPASLQFSFNCGYLKEAFNQSRPFSPTAKVLSSSTL